MRGRMASSIIAACILLATTAHAQELTARQVYDRGAASYNAHEYENAAEDFARADEMSPNDVTLTYALEAAVRSKSAPMVMELVARVEKRVAPGTPLAARAKEARATFGREVGQVLVRCPAPITFCKVTLDNRLVEIGTSTYVTPGSHAVHIEADGVASDRSIQVAAEKTTEVAPPSLSASAATPVAPAPPVVAPVVVAPPPPPPPTTHETSGRKLSTTWFWIGAAVTAVLGGVSIWSGIDTLNIHDDYEQSRAGPTRRDGKSAQTRTNILLAGTAVAGIGTGVLGVFFVGWSGSGATVTARF